jgi:hypothetical protein
MTLDRSVLVPVPKIGVTVIRSGKLPVYKNLMVYRNSKGQLETERVIIGRIDRKTKMLIPNESYWEFFGVRAKRLDIQPEQNPVRMVGASFLVGRIMSSLGISEALDEALGAKEAAMTRTAVIHIVTRGDVFDDVEGYCQGYTLIEAPLTPQSASDLFRSLFSYRQSRFFRLWVAKQHPYILLAYDVTFHSTSAEDVMDKERGYNIFSEKQPTFNLDCFLSEKTRLPIFLTFTYPDSIRKRYKSPWKTIDNERLWLSRVVFVLGQDIRGADKVRHMAREGLEFIIGFDKLPNKMRRAIESSRSTIDQVRNRAERDAHVISKRGVFYGASSVMHVYYDHELEERQKRRLVEEIKSRESELIQLERLSKSGARRYRDFFKITLEADGSFAYERDEDKIKAMADDHGLFGLLTNAGLEDLLANMGLDDLLDNIGLYATQTLAAYRRKDAIKKRFDDVMTRRIETEGLGVSRAETTEGQFFCAFIAFIVVSEIEEKLADLMRERRWSKSHVITEMERIQVVLAPDDKRLISPLTETQRTILDMFGLTEDDLAAYVASSYGDARQA